MSDMLLSALIQHMKDLEYQLESMGGKLRVQGKRITELEKFFDDTKDDLK